MPSSDSVYQNPLASRYASPQMLAVFSDERRYRTWRSLWIALAEAEAELGLPIRPEQIAELRQHREAVDFRRAAELEKELRHDVMAHIRAYGEQCKLAQPIIHLGATSCFVTDNADLILMRDGLKLVAWRLAALLDALRDVALQHRGEPTLAYTHFQPAQLTTVGKRAALWAQDFLLDLEELLHRLDGLRFRGVKGATGTQASFVTLFDGDTSKVEELDRRVSEKMGFRGYFRVTGQTYTRKQDEAVLHALSGIAQSAHKFSTDLRLLQGLGEAAEPFEAEQVGSSAMPYKRNPMRLERISSLAKYVICECQNGPWVQSTQWFERTLDDSANRRLSIPQSFLAVDALLILAVNVVKGLEFYPKVIRRRVAEHFPFLVSEDLLMTAVKAGGDRQILHGILRRHALEVAEAQRRDGAENDLVERLAQDPAFARVLPQLRDLARPEAHIGRAAEQVEAFVADELTPLLDRARDVSSSVEPLVRARGDSWEVRV
jgi:adenylosuccinate lyase